MGSTVILINPWIHDFAAYDLWAKPLGLLCIAGHLRERGYSVKLIDCLDRYHPSMEKVSDTSRAAVRPYGTGKFHRSPIRKPSPLEAIPRTYSRYGILPAVFEEELKKVNDPCAILVTSLMTYWYPGVHEAIAAAKRVHPRTPVILGGIYANLCREHALKNSGADVVSAESEPSGLVRILTYCEAGPPPDPGSEKRAYPAFDLLTRTDYICIQTSSGCPFRCRYCATPFLNPRFSRREPGEVLEEILYWHHKFAVSDFAFYDDALLIDSRSHVSVLLEKLLDLRLELRFHTPNAVHAAAVDAETADLMRRSGFRTIRLGLETSDFSLHRLMDDKIAEGDFERAVGNLLRAGFANPQIGAYILVGLPGQSVDSILDTVRLVDHAGAVPYLAEYSPIPHTPLWEQAVAESEYDLASEPLFHNNSLLPCWPDSKRRELPRLKEQVAQVRMKHR